MKTLNISISDSEYSKFGIKEANLSFQEIIRIVTRQIAKENLKKSVNLAEKYGLSKMSMEDISKEVKVVRRNAKNSN